MKRIGILVTCMFLGFTLASAQDKAGISVSETTYNFGTIYEEDGSVSHEFVVTNTGTAPLELNRVTASCGCTTPNWTKEPIAPGKTGSVNVTYNTKGRIAPFSKSISIYSNAQDAPFVVFIKGEVVSKGSANVQLQQAPVSIEPAKTAVAAEGNKATTGKDDTKKAAKAKKNGAKNSVIKTPKKDLGKSDASSSGK